MRTLTYTVVKNAFANLIRGGASAIVALALPHVLTRALDHDQFAAWALMLQVSAYVNYLDFGLQTAVARYLAQAIELRDDAQRDRVVSTAFGLLAVAGGLACAVLALIAWQLPAIFHSVPQHSLPDLRAGLFVLTVFASLGLPLSVFTGVLIGLHRNEYPAVAIGGSRVLGAVAILVALRHTQSLAILAVCLGGFNFIGSAVQVLIVRRLVPALRVRVACFSREMVHEFAAYCSSLTVWSFGMLLVSGLDVTIVGYFKFGASGSYAIAATLIGFFTGLNNSVFGAMLAPVAVLQSRKEHGTIRRLVTATTKLNTYACMAVSMVTFLWGKELLSLWVGPAYAAQTLPILEILLGAQTIRLIGSAYSTVLIATGQQRYGIIGALVEGVLNLILSVVGMVIIGAQGVAWATLIAAALGIAVLVIIVMPREKEVTLDRALFVREAVAQPILAFVPLAAWIFAREWYFVQLQRSTAFSRLLLIVAIMATLSLVVSGVHQLRKSARLA